MKLCECGCGNPTNKIKNNDKARGRIKGDYFRFICGHNTRKNIRKPHIDDRGRVVFTDKLNSKKFVSRIIAEKVLGKPLPAKAQVHHVDGNPSNNSNNNLVICENQVYHSLLHKRLRAYKLTGNPNAIMPRKKNTAKGR